MGPRPLGNRLGLILIFAALFGTVLAGCFHADGPNGEEPPRQRLWENPYNFTIGFDGWRAYADALAQIYTHPESLSGPRYRIPGSDALLDVAKQLAAALDNALGPVDGSAAIVSFPGSEYYELDLSPVAPYVCGVTDPARERVEGMTFHNVVGRTDPDRLGLILGAHFDSKRHADGARDPEHIGQPILGADDGAGSAAVVIELARAFAADPPGIPLTFLLFDGEDGFETDDCHPLAGSLHYAQNLLADENETALGMVLFDMVGNASARFFREDYSLSYTGAAGRVDSKWLGDAIWGTAADMSVEAFEDRRTGRIADDHLPFLHAGIPAVDILRFEGAFAPYWHTVRDDHTAIQPEGLDQVGAVAEAAIRRLAMTTWADAADA